MLLEREYLLHAFVVDFAGKCADGVAEADANVRPAPGLNTPAWILGHLALCTDYALLWLGEPGVCDDRFGALFGPGSDPAKLPADRPTLATLLGIMRTNHARLGERLNVVGPEAIAGPNPFTPLLGTFPTKGDMLAALLTTHPMLHLGQFSAWRRLRGLPGVMGI